MLGLVLIFLAGILWWPATTNRNTKSWLQRWRIKTAVHGATERNLRAEDLRHHARVVRELASLLRSGQNLDAALVQLARIEAHDSSLVHVLGSLRIHHGASVSEPRINALDNATNSRLLERLQWCVQICAESGAPLAQVLDQLADDLEASIDARRSFDVAMAGPRATSRLLTWLPALGLLGAALFGIDLYTTFVSSLAGQLTVGVGVGLWFVNRWWCRWLLARCTREAVG